MHIQPTIPHNSNQGWRCGPTMRDRGGGLIDEGSNSCNLKVAAGGLDCGFLGSCAKRRVQSRGGGRFGKGSFDGGCVDFHHHHHSNGGVKEKLYMRMKGGKVVETTTPTSRILGEAAGNLFDGESRRTFERGGAGCSGSGGGPGDTAGREELMTKAKSTGGLGACSDVTDGLKLILDHSNMAYRRGWVASDFGSGEMREILEGGSKGIAAILLGEEADKEFGGYKNLIPRVTHYEGNLQIHPIKFDDLMQLGGPANLNSTHLHVEDEYLSGPLRTSPTVFMPPPIHSDFQFTHEPIPRLIASAQFFKPIFATLYPTTPQHLKAHGLNQYGSPTPYTPKAPNQSAHSHTLPVNFHITPSPTFETSLNQWKMMIMHGNRQHCNNRKFSANYFHLEDKVNLEAARDVIDQGKSHAEQKALKVYEGKKNKNAFA